MRSPRGADQLGIQPRAGSPPPLLTLFGPTSWFKHRAISTNSPASQFRSVLTLLSSANIFSIDPRLEQLRTLLVGPEIEVLSRLSEVVEDPEQLAGAVGRVLPTAIALATNDARLGQALAPALAKATQSSIRHDPRTLVNILYPLIVPAIRKSIGETIDETFQSFNESLKHSLTWRGLRWRWEAWRTGTSFAERSCSNTRSSTRSSMCSSSTVTLGC
jgi:hypothetical protein